MMEYELDRGEDPAQGLRRIILERVDYIYNQMVHPQPTREIAVHEARKSFKRIRAALRLVRDETGADWYHRENEYYRDASRLLAAVRDSWIVVETLDAISAEFAGIVSPAAFASIREKLVANHALITSELLDEQDVMETVAQLMQNGRPRIAAMPISDRGFAAFHDGLKRVYRRGRNGMVSALASDHDPHLYHEWRKRVKYLWYQLEILQQSDPEELAAIIDELHILSDYLGDAHDLVMLRETLLAEQELFADELNLTSLLALVERRRLRLETATKEVGEHLFADKPDAFVARVASKWAAWQHDAKSSS